MQRVAGAVVEMSIDDLLGSLGGEGVAFEVTVVGPELLAPITKTRCGYWELVSGARQGGQWASFAVPERSAADLLVAVAGTEVALPLRRLRTFVSSSYLIELGPGQPPPAALVALGLPLGAEVRAVAEHCLALGVRYHALVHVDRFLLPPAAPDGEPGEARNAVLWISDRPFADGAAQQPLTPAYAGWSY